MLFYLSDFEFPHLQEAETQHCLRVLRKRKGDIIEVSDGQGKWASARIKNENPKGADLELIETKTHKPLWNNEIWIAVAPTKQMERMEWMVEKCTEIGVNGFLFFHSARTERDVLKTERLEKAALSAMKQSGQFYLPEILWCQAWKNFPWPQFDHLFIADLENEGENRLSIKPGRNLILIGPEGDFTTDEYLEIRAKGAKSIRLRPQILRTETAAFFAVSMAHLA
jgi:16S rRNA (uracil1498-N3)-methyltransferase